MVSLANEVHSFHTEKKKDVSSFSKPSVIGGLSQEPSLYDVLSYSYCYMGIMTGKSAEKVGCFLSDSNRVFMFIICLWTCCSCEFAFAWI